MMKRPWLFRGLAAAAVVGLVYVASAYVASGSRHFYSPDALDAYWQRELLLPLTDLPIYRSRLATYRYELVDSLVAEGYWSPQESDDPPRPVAHYNEMWKDGQSAIVREFGWSSEFWIAWTKDHPEIADILWPAVLARLREDWEAEPGNDVIGDVGAMLWIAKQCDDVEGFVSTLALMHEEGELTQPLTTQGRRDQSAAD